MKPLRVLPLGAHLALATLPLAAGACVESSVYDRTAAQLDASSRAGRAKDQQIRDLELQVVGLAQQVREAHMAREDVTRDLYAKLTAANASLAERSKSNESDLPAPTSAGAGPGAVDRARAYDMKKLAADLDARHALLLERLARIEQQLDVIKVEQRAAPSNKPKPGRTIDAEVLDPWGFGSRK
jgi:hypothetical protein